MSKSVCPVCDALSSATEQQVKFLIRVGASKITSPMYCKSHAGEIIKAFIAHKKKKRGNHATN